MGKTWSEIDCSNWSEFENLWSDEWCDIDIPQGVQILGAAPGVSSQNDVHIRRNLSESEMMFDPYIQSILEEIEYKRRKGRLTRMEECNMNDEIAARMHYLSINC